MSGEETLCENFEISKWAVLYDEDGLYTNDAKNLNNATDGTQIIDVTNMIHWMVANQVKQKSRYHSNCKQFPSPCGSCQYWLPPECIEIIAVLEVLKLHFVFFNRLFTGTLLYFAIDTSHAGLSKTWTN